MGLFSLNNIRGQQGEDIALAYLLERGLTLVKRNYRSRQGEIDIIMQDNNTLAFIEVRYRSSNQFGGALYSIDKRKQQKLIKCAQHYMINHPSQLGFRFDVIAISPSKTQHDIQWIPNAFDEF